MKLAEMRPGEWATVTEIEDDTMRAQAIRFGIAAGAEIGCDEVIARGPVLIRRGLMQYAIGRSLAERISVELRRGGHHHHHRQRGGR